MKKRFKVLLFVLFFALVLTGCGDKEEGSKKSKTMTREDIVDELHTVNNEITELWNEVICNVSWYSRTGTDSVGDELDIEFLIEHMDRYFNKVRDRKEFINGLSEEYNDIKDAYNKLLEQANIIYDELKKETPKPNVELSYRENISLFTQYQDYLWDVIMDLE